eukprot:CAMPEP_0118633498 /NCGR_PEP_ID=MMETSP0785-20121206/1029_1 /TAXON_ID=91992 /ORGANISM="Bolidomonas pacifica, Strain CCMP 1866" /LENGTH=302 /DNA_ID=CAMNT_0006524377 /DNA_START=335 /DNA_END=1243 /DNA_ORIENTATION=+
MLGLNTIYSSMLGYNADMVPSYQTGAANGVQALLNVIGAMSGMGVFLFTGGDIGIVYGYFIALVGTTIAITAAFVKEETPKVRGGEERRMLHWVSKEAVMESYTLPSTGIHRDFYLVTVSRTFYYMGISSQTFFLYYLRDFVGVDNPEAGVTILTVIAQAGAALASYPTGKVSDRLGGDRKAFIYLSCLVLAAGNTGFMLTKTLKAVVVTAGGNGGYLAMDSALAVDTIPVKKDSARYLGIWGIASFIGTALGPLVGGPVLYIIGGRGEDGGFDDLGYKALLFMSVVYFAIAARVLKGVTAK